jgi:hypothetical protein
MVGVSPWNRSPSHPPHPLRATEPSCRGERARRGAWPVLVRTLARLGMTRNNSVTLGPLPAPGLDSRPARAKGPSEPGHRSQAGL